MTIRRALEGSTFVRVVRRSREAVRTALERSGIETAVDRLATAVRASYCYRWLTTEPEPNVIVIDLRETYTVGPVIRLLDRVVAELTRSYANSRLQSGVDTAVSVLPLRELRASRVGTALAAALEPPEPWEPEPHRAKETTADERPESGEGPELSDVNDAEGRTLSARDAAVEDEGRTEPR